MKDSIKLVLEKIHIHAATRHLFLCLGPDCCSSKEGEKTWDYIKKRTRDLELKIMRTKAACFRICTEGPWLVIYPEGIWYSKVTPKRFERILQEHILQNKPITEWIIAKNSLGS